VVVFYAGPRPWWWFAERFYCETENYTAKDVKALALDRERRKTRVLERAHDLMAVDGNGGLGRVIRSPKMSNASCFAATAAGV